MGICLMGCFFALFLVEFVKNVECPDYLFALSALPVAVAFFCLLMEQFKSIAADWTGSTLTVPEFFQKGEDFVSGAHIKFVKSELFHNDTSCYVMLKLHYLLNDSRLWRLK